MIDRTSKGNAKLRAHRKVRPNIISSEPGPVLAAKAFEEDNAKQLSIESTVAYFVPPKEFKDLFSRSNHILLGSRGSGKTTWVRMLAHDHVLLASRQPGAAYDYARSALQQDMIGIYIPTNIGLVGSLKNKPWQTEEKAELFFQWRLNVHSCAALLPVIRSCIEHYIEGDARRALAELKICRALAEHWAPEKSTSDCRTLESLSFLLSQVETERLNFISRTRASGLATEEGSDYFDNELFQPLLFAIRTISYHVGVPGSATWMVCIDEAEYLTEGHHRILNTLLRTASGDLVFKIATMPFAHHTLATNIGDPVREGHDFKYIFVDQIPIDSRGSSTEAAFLKFAREVFKRRSSRLSQAGIKITLTEMLGPSILLDEKTVEEGDDLDELMALLSRFSNENTYQRAYRLFSEDKKKLRSEILRKMHGALLLRQALDERIGNHKSKIYSGESVVVRCSDGNPRRLMRLLNAMLKRLEQGSSGSIHYPLSPATQNEVLVTIGRDALSRVQSEPPCGAMTHKFLNTIGRHMAESFHEKRIGTDFVTSISVTAGDGEYVQNFIKQAVQLSLLTPAVENSRNGPAGPCEGVFHLAFLFAPLFGLLPRRNKSQRLPQLLANAGISTPAQSHQFELGI